MSWHVGSFLIILKEFTSRIMKESFESMSLNQRLEINLEMDKRLKLNSIT